MNPVNNSSISIERGVAIGNLEKTSRRVAAERLGRGGNSKDDIIGAYHQAITGSSSGLSL